MNTENTEPTTPATTALVPTDTPAEEPKKGLLVTENIFSGTGKRGVTDMTWLNQVLKVDPDQAEILPSGTAFVTAVVFTRKCRLKTAKGQAWDIQPGKSLDLVEAIEVGPKAINMILEDADGDQYMINEQLVTDGEFPFQAFVIDPD